jgi:hypothetical protein
MAIKILEDHVIDHRPLTTGHSRLHALLQSLSHAIIYHVPPKSSRFYQDKYDENEHGPDDGSGRGIVRAAMVRTPGVEIHL